MAQQLASLLEIRMNHDCLLTFSGVFCFNEISQIRYPDLQFSETDVKVRVQHSKYRDVLMARTGSSVYPVVMLERYMSIANLAPVVNWLFRPLTVTQHGHRL